MQDKKIIDILTEDEIVIVSFIVPSVSAMGDFEAMAVVVVQF